MQQSVFQAILIFFISGHLFFQERKSINTRIILPAGRY